ncbi:MAG: hypothetical protein H7Z42_23565 [Roseiflexaceae bacterium]|nr:hypothetical protein [Roseiflexaceae bacterium]
MQLRASTALIREACDGRWTASFGARIQVDPVSLGEQFASDGACVDAFRQSPDVTVAGTRVRYGQCVAHLDPMRVDWSNALIATITAQVAPDAAAACSALLPQSLGDAVAKQLTTQSVVLDAEYAQPFKQPEALGEAPSGDTSGQKSSAGGWVRRHLATMATKHDLRIGPPGDGLSLRLASTPGSSTSKSSPELTMLLGVEGSALNLLPERIKQAVTPALPLKIRWDLDHESDLVFVNDQSVQRISVAPRAPGPTVLTAPECGNAVMVPPRSLYFVEADDRGNARDPKQEEALFRALDGANAGAGALVSVFVHGWQHSAAPRDTYVCDYARIVSELEMMENAAASATPRTARKVVGVYVGWPGKLYSNDMANATTFWNRLQAADRLGAEGALLRRVIQGLAQRLPASSQERRADRRSALIVTGHSLGARAVFHAVRDGLPPPANSVSGARRPDLVLLVNPAFSAELYRGIHEQERQCRPIGVPLLSFSSEADVVTRQVYPTGQTLTFDYASQQAALFPEHVYTAANFGEFVTHRLRMQVASGVAPHPEGDQTIVRGFLRVPEGSKKELYSADLATVFKQPKSGYPKAADVWYSMQLNKVHANPNPCPDSGSKVIEVDAQILPNHGTIFTPAFVEYVVRVLNRSILGDVR